MHFLIIDGELRQRVTVRVRPSLVADALLHTWRVRQIGGDVRPIKRLTRPIPLIFEIVGDSSFAPIADPSSGNACTTIEINGELKVLHDHCPFGWKQPDGGLIAEAEQPKGNSRVLLYGRNAYHFP